MCRARTDCRTPRIDGWAVRTNNPPCGAMRGFGVVQACFAHESQMDKLAAACGLDPVELRLRNAIETGDLLVTGQVLESVAPDGALPARDAPRCRCPPEPPMRDDGSRVPAARAARPTPAHVKRGVGFALAIKNLMYSEGFDDSATARCRLADGAVYAQARDGRGRAGLRHDRRADRTRRSSASTRSCSSRPTPRSGRRGRPRRRARRGCRAARSTWRAARCASACSSTSPQRMGVDPVRLAIEGTDVVDTVDGTRVAVADATAGVSTSRRP